MICHMWYIGTFSEVFCFGPSSMFTDSLFENSGIKLVKQRPNNGHGGSTFHKAKSGQQTTDWGFKQRNGIKARQIYRDLTNNKKIEAMRIEIRDKLYHGTRALLLTQMKVETNVATENNHGKTQSNYNWVQASQFSMFHNFPMLHSKSLKVSSPNPQDVSRKFRPLTWHLALAVPEWRIRATRQSSWAVGPGGQPRWPIQWPSGGYPKRTHAASKFGSYLNLD